MSLSEFNRNSWIILKLVPKTNFQTENFFVNHKDSCLALKQFLIFLARDIKKNPHYAQPIDNNLIKRTQSLISGVDFNLDTPLSDSDE